MVVVLDPDRAVPDVSALLREANSPGLDWRKVQRGVTWEECRRR